MKKWAILIGFLCILTSPILSQYGDFSDFRRMRHAFNRLGNLYPEYLGLQHPSLNQLHSKELYHLAKNISRQSFTIPSIDSHTIQYIFTETAYWVQKDTSGMIRDAYLTGKKERGFLKHFYKRPVSFLEFEGDNYYIRFNPILNLKMGDARNDPDLIFQNTRGLEVTGWIDNKVYFSTRLYENQARFNDHIEDHIEESGFIPGQAFFKAYQSELFDKLSGWDYFDASAQVGFQVTQSIGVELGQGKHFIGQGYRSLLLGDYGPNYFYFKIETGFWKIRYQNLFAELSLLSHIDTEANQLLPKKYMAAHYLNFAFSENLNIGLFEAIIFARENQFEFHYLNPIIFYRAIESIINSPDNVLLGLNFKWNLKKGIQLYGQLAIDELSIGRALESSGWWGNKIGTQVGMQFFNLFGAEHLDGRLEYNAVRPYTYSHRQTISNLPRRTIASYSHYNQPLAHPLGSNFREWVFTLGYYFNESLFVSGKIIAANFGDNFPDENWGGDILLPFTSRIRDFDNKIAQGDERNIYLFEWNISFQLRHNYYLDFQIFHRNQEQSQEFKNYNTTFLGGGLRVNMSNPAMDY